jgi:hypothetical protein
VGLLDLLFGKKTRTKSESRPDSLRPETENLRRWRASEQPRTWVEAHKGQWNHQEWIALLETLQRSSYWPMQPDEVGQVLEDVKAEWGGSK